MFKSFLVLVSLSLVGLFPSGAFAASFSAEVVDIDGNAYIAPKSGKTPPFAKPKKSSNGAKSLEGKRGDALGHLYEEGEVVNDEGKIFVAPGKTVPAVKGQILFPGDVVETKGGAEVELLFEDGNITRIGENSKFTIMQLTVEKNSARRAVIDLAVGKVKNSVLKLANKQSKFEVHTKTAVAGVTGTPHWTVSVSPEFEPKVEVGLLVNGKDSTQGVLVKSTGPKASSVVLKPGSKTEVFFGKPPTSPEKMSAEEIALLKNLLPIKTGMSVQKEKRREFDQKWGAVAANKEPAIEAPPQAVEEPEEGPAEKPKLGQMDYNQVQFDSTPEGGEVYVDGTFLGNTPLSTPVKDGTHNVKISLQGYADWNKKVPTTAGSKVLATLVKTK